MEGYAVGLEFVLAGPNAPPLLEAPAREYETVTR